MWLRPVQCGVGVQLIRDQLHGKQMGSEPAFHLPALSWVSFTALHSAKLRPSLRDDARWNLPEKAAPLPHPPSQSSPAPFSNYHTACSFPTAPTNHHHLLQGYDDSWTGNGDYYCSSEEEISGDNYSRIPLFMPSCWGNISASSSDKKCKMHEWQTRSNARNVTSEGETASSVLGRPRSVSAKSATAHICFSLQVSQFYISIFKL